MGERDESRDDGLRRLCEAFRLLETPQEVLAFLRDVCSAKELEELSQRLEVATMLRAGAPYVEVSRATGASSTTVSRVSKCLNCDDGGSRTVLARLAGE